jgi:SAM-dependent methyltransferase
MSDKELARERARELASDFIAQDKPLDWFEAFYKESAGDTSAIPWADLEPNAYLKKWAEQVDLRGEGRTALVVGCGLGDDARYLNDLGFRVTGFDISPTAIEWAKQMNGDASIQLVTADLFNPPQAWRQAFDFVLEVYTIQPLPLEMRPQVIDQIASFAAVGGELVVVTRGRGDNDQPDQMPWPVSRRDLTRFEQNGLTQTSFVEMAPEDPEEPARFVVTYKRT